jgi:hypothetical protein
MLLWKANPKYLESLLLVRDLRRVCWYFEASLRLHLDVDQSEGDDLSYILGIVQYMGGWKHFWDGLFGNAKHIGLKPKNIILIVLSAFGFGAMALGASPWAVIAAVVIFYCLDPLLKFAKSWHDRRNHMNQRTIVATDFQRHLKRKRKELGSDQPELPLSLPPTDPTEP